ncbi:MAG: ABC-type transporter, periplasmic subunit family 3 [Gemmatimonadetes bacterium]|jgi:polar amino acid transport system substrate-binding protein|nr:ABC-type transporter, periplasmic subunit family 3 [Gemmatimonadota bacterium]
MRRLPPSAALGVLVALLAACDLPRDPAETLLRIQGRTMRVGIAVNPPWTTDSAGAHGGVEPALVRELAHELKATVEWTSGGEGVLLPRLHTRDLDLVIGGLDAATPWAGKVGITRPYHTVREPERRELVWAVAPGENAWQMRVERFLRARRTRIDRMLTVADSGAPP